ncbi:MAG: hypothetical protein M0R28_20935 [Pigmentiphaga sp.]|nr:hypothetical protein [Pigmentiphaga sp.]
MPTDEAISAPSVVGPNARAAADALGGSNDDTDAGEKKRYRRKKPKAPKDFESEATFLQHVRKLYSADVEADRENRDEMTLDARFLAGEQWEQAVKTRRNAANKPTLTINRLPAYVAQLVGNRRLNDTGLKVIPDTGGTREIAKVREGLIRNIQKVSNAQYVFDKAFEQTVIGGLGNFQIHLDYAHDDVFEQDIRFAAIPNPLSVVWDQNSVDPSGADAEHVFVIDKMPRSDFKKLYPDAQAGDFDAETSNFSRTGGWDTADTVQIASFWRMLSEPRIVALMKDGSVQDVTELDVEEWFDVVALDQDNEPMIREVQRKYAQMYLLSSQDILAGPYEIPVQRVPVFRVPGWELFIEGDRIRWGLVRFARDPQRLHNYWRSTIAEKLVGAPKAKWLAADTAVEGREDTFRKSHISDDPLLVWNADSGQAPVRTPPLDMEGALIEQAGVASQDIRDVLNIHEANLGIQSNEVSGRAIMARQRVGEVGTVIYQDNLNMAIEEAGKVVNQLIPFVYDTPRIIKVLGPDMQTEELVKINDEGGIDITTGKYSISVTTGPSYTTRRVEAREEMMAVVNAMPNVMGVAADKIVEAQDWPGADEIARRLRTQLPAGIVNEQDMDPQQAQAQQAAQQAQQKQQELAEAMAQLTLAEKQAEVELKQAQVAEAQARAQEAQARAQKALADIAVDQAGVQIDQARVQNEQVRVSAQAARDLANVEQGRARTVIDAVDRLSPAENGARNNG